MYLPQFDEDRAEAIQRAKANGVQAILLPNIDLASVEPMRQMCSDFPGYCFPMAGLHPTNVRDDYKLQLADVEKQLRKNDIVGIGETGIDLYWDKSTLKEQIIAFEHQLKLAVEKNLPIVIHARDSLMQIFEVLENFSGNLPKGVFHCFSGDVEAAKRVVDFGMYIGIGGVATFKNGGLEEVICTIPFDKIVVETDSPYLAPMPHRGKRNESSYLNLVVKKIAGLKGLTSEDVTLQTTQNALTLFPIEINH
jgi:TatD DNase family protein